MSFSGSLVARKMRAAAIFGLGSSTRDLKPFEQGLNTEWVIGQPGDPAGLAAILVFGGDGTLHRHLGALVKLALPVLVVPAGSGNDFARALALRRVGDSVAAWRRFASGGGNVRTIDLGLITPLDPAGGALIPPGRQFSCVAGVGLDGEISRRANALPRWLRGHGGYALSLPGALLGFRPFHLKLSMPQSDAAGEFLLRSQQPVTAAVFANTPVYGGGMRIAPRALMDDGQLDVCVIRDIAKLKLLGVFPSVYLGKHLGIREVEYYVTPRVRVETEQPREVYADGEYVCRTPVEVGVARGALQVVVP
ncbi:MAG TPA: diacylglycerol kinase family protein [Terriglobales bacterium]|jgi:diacylglycerol kinase (ATP)|nr:diacylglycerol kinase family protein [Terriglobales bacterium]